MLTDLYHIFASGMKAWGSAGTALLVASGLTPLVAHLARKWDWVDRPSDDRWHDRPVALMGGIAIAAAVAVSVAVVGGAPYPWPVWAGAGLLFGLGLADDLWDVRPDVKVLAQVVATVGVLYAGFAFWRGGPAWVSMPLTFLWIIGVTNALNLIDGIDGLAAGVTAVAAGALLFVSLAVGKPGLAAVMGALLGAALGFLVYNAPPARVFMGDCGSLLLGYLLAVGALGVQGSGGPVVGTLVPIAVLAVPLFDTIFVALTRLLRGVPITQGGTDHVHHRLLHQGLSERRAVAILTGTSAVCGGIALMTLWTKALFALAIAALGLVGAAVIAGYLVTTDDGGDQEEPFSRTLTAQVGAVMRSYVGGMYWKSVGGLLADLLVVASSFVIAVHLQFDEGLPPDWAELLGWALPGVVAAKLIVFHASGLYEGMWRHAGTPEVVRLIRASFAASVLVGVGVTVGKGAGPELLPVLFADWGLAAIGVGGVRFGFRALRQYLSAHRQGQRRVFICGSGSHEMLLLRHLRHCPELGRTVVGFVDDDEDRHGYRAQGVEVLGGSGDLLHLCSDRNIDEVIVPLKTTTTEERRDVRALCREAGVACQYFDISLQDGHHAALSDFVERQSRAVTPSTFRQLLGAEIARLERGPHSVSALLAVEVLGQHQGQNSNDPSVQAVLEDVARASERSIRSSDCLSIWDASTCLFLLAGTDEEGAWRVGERLAREVETCGEAPGPPPDLDAAVEPVRPDADPDELLSELLGETSPVSTEKRDGPKETPLSPA